VEQTWEDRTLLMLPLCDNNSSFTLHQRSALLRPRASLFLTSERIGSDNTSSTAGFTLKENKKSEIRDGFNNIYEIMHCILHLF
jgi:hypothetical protein